jgi:hypothetical protein
MLSAAILKTDIVALLVKEVGIGQIINPAYYIKITEQALICPLNSRR